MAKSNIKKSASTIKTASKKTAKKKVSKKKVVKKTAPIKKTVKKAAAKKTVAKTPTRKASTSKRSASAFSKEERRMMIAMHAYYKWEKAGFPGGQDWQHWLEAEKEVEDMLK
jgi:hypothetical protein